MDPKEGERELFGLQQVFRDHLPGLYRGRKRHACTRGSERGMSSTLTPSSAATSRRVRRLTMPTLRAMASAVSGWSPVTCRAQNSGVCASMLSQHWPYSNKSQLLSQRRTWHPPVCVRAEQTPTLHKQMPGSCHNSGMASPASKLGRH